MGDREGVFDVERLREQIGQLQRPGRRPRSVDESLSTLNAALEELQVASEELRVQNEELARTAELLERERERFQHLYDLLPDGYMVVDAGGVVIEANPRAGQLLGRPASALIGEPVARLLGADAGEEVRSLRNRRSPSALVDLDGAVMEVRVEPYPAAGGEATAWLLRDLGGLEGEGEDLTTTDAAVARSWLSVFSELIAITETAIAAMERIENPETPTGRRVQGDRRALQIRLARLRRRQAMWRERHAELAGMELDRASGLLKVGLNEVSLTRREAQLLGFLLQHPGVSFTAETLVNRAWLASFLSHEQLRTYVGRLRSALTAVGAPCQLVNRRGRGYALEFK